MDWLVVGIQWLHVLLGILWLGSALFINLVLFPVVMRFPLDRAREIGRAVIERSDRVLGPAALLVVTLGVVRGIAGGRIDGLDAILGSTYGQLYGLSAVVGVITVGLGIRAGRALMAAYRRDDLWVAGADGGPNAALTARIASIRVIGLLELIGFFVLFTAMILMRFS